jgi:hypothetical protein
MLKYNNIYLQYAMGVITLKIDDDLEEGLRRRAGEVHGAAKGAISQSVEEALKLWLSQPASAAGARRTYVGFWEGRQVAEAIDLKTLAEELRAKGIDPRKVEIRTEPSEPAVTKMGLRTRAAPG